VSCAGFEEERIADMGFVSGCSGSWLGRTGVVAFCLFGAQGLGLAQWVPGANGSISYSGGNVGIGTTSPGSSYYGVSPVATSPVLDLKSAGPSNATLLRLISAPSSAGSYFAGIEFDANDTSTANQSYNVGRIYGVFDAATWSAGRMTFSTLSGAGAWVDTMSLKNGNVGIGTTNPQHLLHVAGTVGAEEVIVSSTGADYVFEPGYRLAPLSEVSAYIEKNHHLPGIPSAAEGKEKGVGVADMQSKLLAKIEELTLHMIQAEERNNRLEERNRELQKQMQSMQTRFAFLDGGSGGNNAGAERGALR
jgi:hypothetical protein